MHFKSMKVVIAAGRGSGLLAVFSAPSTSTLGQLADASSPLLSIAACLGCTPGIARVLVIAYGELGLLLGE